MLLAGTSTGLIHIYDIASHQLLRTLSSHKGVQITHLATMLRPPDLVGHVSLSLGVGGGDAKEGIPVRPVAPFQRIRDGKAREAHEVSLLLPQIEVCLGGVYDASREVDFGLQTSTTAFFGYSREDLIKDHTYFVKPSGAGPEANGMSLQTRVTELESEVARLREQLGKAKGINDVMWETVVQRLVAEGKEKKHEGEVLMVEDEPEQGGGGRRRKRNRT